MDFLMDQTSLYTSKKYEDIYMHLNTKYEMKYHEIFLLAASLGFKKNRQAKVDGRGREMRTNFFNSSQKATVYSIILSDKDLGKNIESFESSEFARAARKKLEAYAEGGMDILVEEVFQNRWDGNKLDSAYGEYEVDLLSYVYQDCMEVPF